MATFEVFQPNINSTGKTTFIQNTIVFPEYLAIEADRALSTQLPTESAPINNPTFQGTVTLPTVSPTSNDNTAATTSFVNQVVGTKLNAVIDRAPQALDTLNELAAAINDDANYASTAPQLYQTDTPKQRQTPCLMRSRTLQTTSP